MAANFMMPVVVSRKTEADTGKRTIVEGDYLYTYNPIYL
jgi:hypothetical protein